MATSCMTALRTLTKGVLRGPSRWLLAQSCHTPAAYQGLSLHGSRCRPLHVSVCSSRTEPRRSSHTDAQRDRGTAEEEPEEPEYIPKKKAKNPMMVIGYAWMIGLPSGIILFLLTKREVDKNRQKQLKIRQRMKRSNEGEYEGSRYRHTENVKLDQ